MAEKSTNIELMNEALNIYVHAVQNNQEDDIKLSTKYIHRILDKASDKEIEKIAKGSNFLDMIIWEYKNSGKFLDVEKEIQVQPRLARLLYWNTKNIANYSFIEDKFKDESSLLSLYISRQKNNEDLLADENKANKFTGDVAEAIEKNKKSNLHFFLGVLGYSEHKEYMDLVDAIEDKVEEIRENEIPLKYNRFKKNDQPNNQADFVANEKDKGVPGDIPKQVARKNISDQPDPKDITASKEKIIALRNNYASKAALGFSFMVASIAFLAVNPAFLARSHRIGISIIFSVSSVCVLQMGKKTKECQKELKRLHRSEYEEIRLHKSEYEEIPDGPPENSLDNSAVSKDRDQNKKEI